MKRIEARVDNRARRRERGENVIISLGLQAGTQKVSVLTTELARCKNPLQEAQGKYYEASGALEKLKRSTNLPGSDVSEVQNNNPTQENEQKDQEKYRKELQKHVISRRRRQTILCFIVRGGFAAQQLSEVDMECLRCKEEAEEASSPLPVDEEEEKNIRAAAKSISTLNLLVPSRLP